MDNEELMHRLLKLEQSVEALNSLAAKSVEAATGIAISRTTREVKIEAIIETIISLLRELAEHEGISEEKFQKHFDRRVRHYHDFGLRTVEDISPERAALADKRALNEVGEDEAYPRLFDI